VSTSKLYRRESEGIEFDRVAFFTDAVFAIAITLLVVEVGLPEAIPDPEDPADLIDAVADKLPVIAAFFVGCFVIGSYWSANHRFVSQLGAVDRRMIAYTVVYLAFIAFLPFPTGILGEYAENPISIAIFAVNLGIVSSLEALLFHHAWKAKLLKKDMPADVAHWVLVLSLFPVLMFALSIPVAFIYPWLGVAVWAGSAPFQAWFARRRPADAAAYFG
jgi:uncharacterized membrane protein